MKKETRKKSLRYLGNSILGMCIYLFYGFIFDGNNTKMFPATCIADADVAVEEEEVEDKTKSRPNQQLIRRK